jgi:hypothetical protein
MSCPDCGGIVAVLEGCELCINCGWSPCFMARLVEDVPCVMPVERSCGHKR